MPDTQPLYASFFLAQHKTSLAFSYVMDMYLVFMFTQLLEIPG